MKLGEIGVTSVATLNPKVTIPKLSVARNMSTLSRGPGHGGPSGYALVLCLTDKVYGFSRQSITVVSHGVQGCRRLNAHNILSRLFNWTYKRGRRDDAMLRDNDYVQFAVL